MKKMRERLAAVCGFLVIGLALSMLVAAASPSAQRNRQDRGANPAAAAGNAALDAQDQLAAAGGDASGAAADSAAPRAAAKETTAADVLKQINAWPKPKALLVISGRQHGYIEPCGCAGLANQKGGLMRRFTLIKKLRATGWNVIPLDVGNQVRRFGVQAGLKFQRTAQALKDAKYAAVGFGPDDLKLSVDQLLPAVAGLGGGAGPFVSANAAFTDLEELTHTHRVIDASGYKVGVTAVLGKKELRQVNNSGVTKGDPAAALAKAMQAIEAAGSNAKVLLAHASLEETKQLAKQVAGFDLVATAGGATEPAYRLETIEGTKSQLLQVGGKGMYVSVVGLYDDPQQPLRFARVPLDASLPDAPEMVKLMTSYQQQLETLGLSGLGVRRDRHPSGRQFVGSNACKDCHDEAYDIWSKTGHAHAMKTLQKPPERYHNPRHFDPECLSCHVTGWNPQGYYPYASGYKSLKTTPHLINNGCENCHGPGSAHVAAESGDIDVSAADMKKLQLEMRLPLAKARAKCLECHDLDNSPDFHKPGAYEKYLERIRHWKAK